MSRFVGRLLAAVAVVWCGLAPGLAAAQNQDPDNVQVTLEGCRFTTGLTLPNADGKFICADANYTTGNLQSGWNEYDLVPHRLTTSAGNSAPATQTYRIAVVLDYENVGRPGYDVISVPALNAGKSAATCKIESVAPAAGAGGLDAPGLGGIDKSIFRILTITQPRNTTCVFDFHGRLAIGASQWPGASLHANAALPRAGDDDGLAAPGGASGLLVDLTTQAVGARDVSIPVKGIKPQSISKTMSASQSSGVTWNLRKEADKASVSFGDICKANEPAPTVSITVTWTRNTSTPGIVVITTVISATNPAAREAKIQVTDTIRRGSLLQPGAELDKKTFDPVVVGPNSTKVIATHTIEKTAAEAGNVGDFVSDVAEATYIDDVTGIPVAATTKAQAEAQIQQGSVSGGTVSVADLEKIDLANPNNAGLSFSVAAVNPGSFLGGYNAGDKANTVEWGATGLTASGSVVFNKTLYLDPKRIVSGGVLTDIATLASTDNSYKTTSNELTVGISSTATTALTIKKSIPALLGTGEKIEVQFRITGPAFYEATRTLTFTGGGATTISSDPITGLAPGVYNVEEMSVLFFAAGSATGTPAALVPDGGSKKTVNLDVVTNGDLSKCSGTAEFVNRVPDDSLPIAQVSKVTIPALQSNDPDYKWTFTLTGPGLGGGVTAVAEAGQPAVTFLGTDGLPLRLQEGNYVVTETTKSPSWVLTDPSTNECKFTVNLPQDTGKTFSCSFTNTKQGKVLVEKTVSGLPPSGSASFTFQLRSGATVTATGTTLETQTANAANGGSISFASQLVPGNTYQLCEQMQPGWNWSLANSFVPNSQLPGGGVNPNVDNSIVCADFSVVAGETKTIKVDNSPPPGGRAHTIGYWKNWASCKKSGGKQAPTLDKTLAAVLPNGILMGTDIKSLAKDAFGLYGQTAASTVDCPHAVSLLSKQDFGGKNRASDPLFNMSAQLVAAELNYAAGAAQCIKVSEAISDAEKLLNQYDFVGTGYTGTLTAADATKANNLATRLDNYNNNRASACQ